jgi:hypothetical protein
VCSARGTTTGSTIEVHCNKREVVRCVVRLRLLALVLIGACCPTAARAAEPAALASARALYNSANYDGAITAAATVRHQPQWADAAGVVIARSHLERFRLGGDPADLTAARDTLSGVRAAALTARDQLALLIGLGQSLYLAEMFGPAAEIFDNALGRSFTLAARDRLLLLDWWATALDREASTRPADRRAAAFTRIADRMEEELRDDPGSRVANYWLAASARGAGDIERAWDAAIAAWVRASLSLDAPALRAELDRLMTTALIQERARQRPAREQTDAQNAFRAEWETIKQEWK